MSLTDWKAAGWLVEHRPTQDETRALLGVIERDLRDSEVTALSADTQLGLAYNAALQADTIALAAHGYRASRERKHYVTIRSLSITIGTDGRCGPGSDLGASRHRAPSGGCSRSPSGCGRCGRGASRRALGSMPVGNSRGR